MSEIKPEHLAKWFRDKAVEFNKIAETLESTFSAPHVRGSSKEVTVGQIKDFLKKKPSRAQELAATFGTRLRANQVLRKGLCSLALRAFVFVLWAWQ